MIEKTGDSQIIVARDHNGNLTMRLPGSPDIVPYDGRFGSIPLPPEMNLRIFPVFKEGGFVDAN